VRFFEQAHIKDACSFLRLLGSPEDELAFARVLELLPGVGPRTTARLWRKLGGACDLYDAQRRADIAAQLPAAARAGWEGMCSAIPERPVTPEALAPRRAVTDFLAAFYETYAAETFENAQRRLEDLQQMAAFTERFATLQEFLSDVSLLTNLDAEQEDLSDAERNAVRLSTVHQAKGLEWRVVVVLWATDGMFPSSRSMTESDDGADEERRLFYVAVTRAQDELVMCVPQVRHMPDGGVIYCEPSRFVAELDPALVRDVLM
jgi:DNA helicase II / ATP-dependent DNA helicase PcrA